IVICSAAAPHYLVRPEHVAPAIDARRGRPMFFIDISVPRNIDPAVNDVSGSYCYDIDDLESVVRANRKEREREAVRAEELVEQELADICDLLRSLEWAPSIAAVRQKADQIAREELEKTLKSLRSVSEEDRARLEKMTQAIVSKMLHEPIRQVKEDALAAAREEEAEARRDHPRLVGAFRKLFGIDD
ncbi:MAG: glutamyl-tRNA reductase, partial [Candidatus Methylomirabilis sp.]|nr:glutamyl-tRNA reductase [Deltaproteobacteria bacterium]